MDLILQIWKTGDTGARIYYICAVFLFLCLVVIFVYLVVKECWVIVRCYGSSRVADLDKKYPKNLKIPAAGNVLITLERVWFRGEWRYMVKGGLPYSFGPPEQSIRMSPFDEKVLANMDILTGPGGEYDVVVKKRYGR